IMCFDDRSDLPFGTKRPKTGTKTVKFSLVVHRRMHSNEDNHLRVVAEKISHQFSCQTSANQGVHGNRCEPFRSGRIRGHAHNRNIPARSLLDVWQEPVWVCWRNHQPTDLFLKNVAKRLNFVVAEAFVGTMQNFDTQGFKYTRGFEDAFSDLIIEISNFMRNRYSNGDALARGQIAGC